MSGASTTFNVSVNLNASDGSGQSSIKEITYSATGATTIASTTVGATQWFRAGVSAPKVPTTLTFAAKDNVGNTETSKTFTIRIDKTAPVITDLGPTTSPMAPAGPRST